MRSIGTRLFAGVSAAVVLGFGAAACGSDDVDKDKLVSKIQDEEGVSKDVADCAADVYIEYVKGDVLNDYVDGDNLPKSADDGLKDGDKEEEFAEKAQECQSEK